MHRDKKKLHEEYGHIRTLCPINCGQNQYRIDLGPFKDLSIVSTSHRRVNIILTSDSAGVCATSNK